MAKNPRLKKSPILHYRIRFFINNNYICIGNSTFSIRILNLGKIPWKILKNHQNRRKMSKIGQIWSKITKNDQNRRKSRKIEKIGPTHENENFYYQKSKKFEKNRKYRKNWKITKNPKFPWFSFAKIRISQCFPHSNPIFWPGRAEKNGPEIDDNFLVPAANRPTDVSAPIGHPRVISCFEGHRAAWSSQSMGWAR